MGNVISFRSAEHGFSVSTDFSLLVQRLGFYQINVFVDKIDSL